MSGPGEYVADRTEGITRVEDLPKAKVVKRSRNLPRRPCPQCGRSCYRHRTMQRTLHDLGDLVSELYDGPFCVLSIADNRTFRRITYDVLDHDPTHADIVRFFRAFHSALEQRGLTLRGITTDGSALYPEPISKVFGDVPHQLCEFHVITGQTGAAPTSSSSLQVDRQHAAKALLSQP